MLSWSLTYWNFNFKDHPDADAFHNVYITESLIGNLHMRKSLVLFLLLIFLIRFILVLLGS